MNRRLRLLGAPTVAFILLAQSACVVIGFGAGSVVDNAAQRVYSSDDFLADSVPPGTGVTLTLHDGNVVKGKYLGLEVEPEADYAERYDSVRSQLAPLLSIPPLGDTVWLYSDGDRAVVEFLGFDLRRLRVRRSGTTTLLNPTEVDSLVLADGSTVNGDVLEISMAELPVPFATVVALESTSRETFGDTLLVPLESLDTATHKSTKGRWLLTLFGVALDVVVLLALMS